ncbi:ribonuclease H-like domain, reverse transcriptase, RNA-dependent DNA polymerase, partial [Tanacetum coccineum]
REEIIQHCLFACFLSQIKPKKISEALEDKSWVDAMQEELLEFKIQKVWILIDFPYGKKAIRSKWVYRNKKDERGVVVRNKARLVAQGHRQEERIDYDERSSCDEFEALMKSRFQMSSMGKLTFFLGLQVKQKEKEKGVELKNVEDIERPRPTSTRSVLTLKPLPKIDPKAKGKGMIEEEDESDNE